MQPPSDLAYSDLKKRLLLGAFDDGRLPPERELAGQLGVSRRSLREALDLLESEQLIWRRQGHGTFATSHALVREPVLATLAHKVNPLELVEARLAIEPLLVRRAAIRAAKEEVEALTRLAEAGRNAADARSYEAFDIAFHRKLAECADNALLAAMFEMTLSVREKADWARNREYHFEHGGREQTFAEHMVIINAIAAHDPVAAEAAMRDHLRNVARSTLGTDVGLG